ncbi:MAG: pirin family protein [Planctomycetes bacterium]|nr:pirin family protein [Planctomycetota bacterium]
METKTKTESAQGQRKRVLGVFGTSESHWVGDGFPVRSLFSYHDSGEELSPFLLLDYGGPRRFEPTTERLGVGPHPHRGFETVTIVYAGEVEHRDSAGGGGKIGPGDVQWMTAASGLVHEEFHGRDFARSGGMFEMVQLWVNLPAQHKWTKPRYQALLDADIPAIELPGNAGKLRVIAGEYDGKRGPAQTFTPIHVWDIRLQGSAKLAVPEGFTTALVVLQGEVRVDGAQVAGPASYVLFDRNGTAIEIESTQGAKILLLAGEPIAEPIAGYGPFVMNTEAEIHQAIRDFQSGKMGGLS